MQGRAGAMFSALPPAGDAPPQEMREPPQMTAITPAAAAPEPSKNRKEPSLNTRKRAWGDADAISILSQLVPSDLATAFADHRKAKRSMLTTKAAELIARKLQGCRDPVRAIETSIENGWTGVFPQEAPERHEQESNVARLMRVMGDK